MLHPSSFTRIHTNTTHIQTHIHTNTHTYKHTRCTTEKMLISSRNQQVQHKEHFLALQAMQDREEFERVLK